MPTTDEKLSIRDLVRRTAIEYDVTVDEMRLIDGTQAGCNGIYLLVLKRGRGCQPVLLHKNDLGSCRMGERSRRNLCFALWQL